MATKKITKKTTAKAAPAKKDAPAKKTPAKKAAAKAKTKVDRTSLENITNVEDLYSLIRDTYNEKAEKNITKDEVKAVMEAFKDAFLNFASNSESEKATFIVPEIGRFTVFVVGEHESINPKTMKKVLVPTKKRVRFKAFPRFVDSVNGVED